MGRSYRNEIGLLPETLKWSLAELDISDAKKVFSKIRDKNLLVVGSGGSFSAATYIAKIHEFITGHLSKAITPLEFSFQGSCAKNTAVIFLTSSGNNKDILDSFKQALVKPYILKIAFCLNKNGKLLKLLKNNPNTLSISYSSPVGKDGFLAVNSLIAFCVIAARAFNLIEDISTLYKKLITTISSFKSDDFSSLLTKETILSIGGDWSIPVLVDFESKFSEAALGNVLISDFRNFGHGRHNWIDKRGNNSGIISFETPETYSIADRTFKLLPNYFPIRRVQTKFKGPIGTIDLFLCLFHLVSVAGEISNIDPGRPGIPEFGRKLFKIGIPSKKAKSLSNETKEIWINRKSNTTAKSPNELKEFLDQFLRSIDSRRFKGIVFDYDGTLVSDEERFTKPSNEISTLLNNILERNIKVGIATGRGKSVQVALRKSVLEEYWDKVIVGNYNGSFVKHLSEDIPSNYDKPIKDIGIVAQVLKNDQIISNDIIENRRKQITISPKNIHEIDKFFNIINELLFTFRNVRIYKSDHSIDIIHNSASKLNLLKEFENIFSINPNYILKIGDQGEFPGNDFELLSEPFSLSVDKVSSSLTTCWNISPNGLEKSSATAAIMKKFMVHNNYFTLDTSELM